MKILSQETFFRFRKNKRSFYSLIILSSLFFFSLFAEFIANDKPILIWHNGKILFPIFNEYSEAYFGGDFRTEADYKDDFVINLIKKNDQNFIIWSPIKYSYDTINYDSTSPFPTPPSKENLLGTDDEGRDVLSRVIYGFRISILFAITLTFCSSVIGILIGGVQGYFGGKTDLIMQRFIEIWSSLPVLFILIIMSAFVTPNFWWLFFIMLLFSWQALVGVVRAEFLKTRNLDYVKIAKAIGVSKTKILLKHILPNSLTSSVSMLPFILGGSLIALTSLDFLGLGMPPGSPSIGELLAQGKRNISAVWLGITGFIVISLMTTLFIFIGEGIRDAINPRK